MNGFRTSFIGKNYSGSEQIPRYTQCLAINSGVVNSNFEKISIKNGSFSQNIAV